MDVAAIAAFLVSAQRQQTQLDVATALVKQQSEQDRSLIALIDEGLANSLAAAPPPGTGLSLDVTV